MGNLNYRDTGVVTRDPLHIRGKNYFCTNFHDLAFTLDGKEIEADEVITAYIRLGVLQTVVRDHDGEVKYKDEYTPMTEEHVGEVKVRGMADTCGCNMTEFKQPFWWKIKRVGQNI